MGRLPKEQHLSLPEKPAVLHSLTTHSESNWVPLPTFHFLPGSWMLQGEVWTKTPTPSQLTWVHRRPGTTAVVPDSAVSHLGKHRLHFASPEWCVGNIPAPQPQAECSPLSRQVFFNRASSGLEQRLVVEFTEGMQTAQPLGWLLWLCALGMPWVVYARGSPRCWQGSECILGQGSLEAPCVFFT